jgi:hypothetical protein
MVLAGSAAGRAHRHIQVVQLDPCRRWAALLYARVDFHDRLIALGSHEGVRFGAPMKRLLGLDAVALDVEVAIDILDQAHRPPPQMTSAMGSLAFMVFPLLFAAGRLIQDHVRAEAQSDVSCSVHLRALST